jgi:hypothetical protein
MPQYLNNPFLVDKDLAGGTTRVGNCNAVWGRDAKAIPQRQPGRVAVLSS